MGKNNDGKRLAQYVRLGTGRRLWQYEKGYVRNCAILYSVAAVLTLLYIGKILVLGNMSVEEIQKTLHMGIQFVPTEAGLHTKELQSSMVCVLPGFLLLASMGLRYGCGIGSSGSKDFMRTLPFTNRNRAAADIAAELGVLIVIYLLMWFGTVFVCRGYGSPGQVLDRLVVRINRECVLILFLTLQMYFWVKVIQTFFASNFMGMVAACLVYGAKYPGMLFIYGMQPIMFLRNIEKLCEEFTAYGLVQQTNLESREMFLRILGRYSVVLLVLILLFVWRNRKNRRQIG